MLASIKWNLHVRPGISKLKLIQFETPKKDHGMSLLGGYSNNTRGLFFKSRWLPLVNWQLKEIWELDPQTPVCQANQWSDLRERDHQQNHTMYRICPKAQFMNPLALTLEQDQKH
ncbi:hypothetical protein FQN57_006597 [Myotisia sp. PD_48]|nr:hypothetical protein FQN57_006597 [Myotisia sp. PD_48]